MAPLLSRTVSHLSSPSAQSAWCNSTAGHQNQSLWAAVESIAPKIGDIGLCFALLGLLMPYSQTLQRDTAESAMGDAFDRIGGEGGVDLTIAFARGAGARHLVQERGLVGVGGADHAST